MDKMKMQTKNIADENYEKLAKLFPNAVTETIDENGQVVRAIDKDVLMQEINTTVVDDKDQRYQFTWPDKNKSIIMANSPINKTLRPCREESVDFDNTENLYIEGDNLEVLKLLRETYLGQIKMIYIDPPYNTGKDFIYKDNFKQTVEEYMDNSGQYDEDGNRLVKNLDRNGRFHTDWLNMIYPRLRVAKDFLTDNGLIFISINDEEVRNLKILCDEIFGYKNFIAQLIWQNKKGGGNDSKFIAVEHEYVIVYAKNKISLENFYEAYSPEYIERYKEQDEIGRFYWDTFKRKSGKQYYPITCPDGTVLEYDDDGNPISWLRSKSRFESDVKKGEVRFVNSNGKWSIQFKQRIPKGKTPRSIFTTNTVISDKGTTSTGSNDVYNYFKKDVFSNPKPIELIKFLIGFGMNEDDIVMDFFSGSGTTAEAIMRESINNCRCKYILVQLQEDIRQMLNSPSQSARIVAQNAIEFLEQHNKPCLVTELAKERIRRASKKIAEENPDAKFDGGFRVLKCDGSNMKDVFYYPDEYNEPLFSSLVNNIKDDRTPEDLLFQTMLDLGILLSSKIEETTIAGKRVFTVNRSDDLDSNADLIACFDDDVTDEVITEIAKKQPTYFVMRDSSMADDSVATNFEQIFSTYSPITTRRVI